jgi:hypothetical protein
MTQIAVLFVALSASLCGHAQTAAGGAPGPSLRALLQQKAAPAGVAAREISAEQRAELRRQVQQAGRPAGKRP